MIEIYFEKNIFYIYPSRESYIVDESKDIRLAEISERGDRHDEDPGGGRHLVHLDLGEDLRHLALHSPRVKQPGRGQQDPVNPCSVFRGSSIKSG